MVLGVNVPMEVTKTAAEHRLDDYAFVEKPAELQCLVSQGAGVSREAPHTQSTNSTRGGAVSSTPPLSSRISRSTSTAGDGIPLWVCGYRSNTREPTAATRQQHSRIKQADSTKAGTSSNPSPGSALGEREYFAVTHPLVR
jgi:hypothetical protein